MLKEFQKLQTIRSEESTEKNHKKRSRGQEKEKETDFLSSNRIIQMEQTSGSSGGLRSLRRI